LIITLEQEFRNGKSVLHSDIRSKISFRARGYKDKLNHRMVVHQNPNEVHQFLMWMKDHQIQKYAEDGIHSGGMLCLVDQFLRAHFKDVKTYGVDIVDVMIDYEEYHKKYPKCIFEKINNEWEPKEQFDLIFIDNNLRGKLMTIEARRLRKFAKYIAFHDIQSYRYGSRNFWYGGEAQKWGKEAYWHDGGPGIGIVKC